MNKLSELSKPVGFVSKQAQALLKSGDTASVRPFFDVQGSSPLYSQEYVSALKHESAVNWEAAASLNVENQELKKRIAELEQVPTIKHMRSVEESLIRATDMVSELEAKLATPVRLPEAHSTLFRQHIRSDYKSLQAFKADEVIAALREQGFTVEGDE
ncbi:hypothetical protein I5M74_15125 [Serratia marcescens]|nr:hypothetical protein [Serratia marcescens]